MRFTKYILGIAYYIPGLHARFGRSGGDTASARYCYSVWLRHVQHAHNSGAWNFPKTVAELGPGQSLGIGLAAILSGAEQYFAFDVVKYATNAQNLNVFDQLVELFQARADIPGGEEFPEVKPHVENYQFPHDALPDAIIDRALEPQRVARIRAAISDMEQTGSPIRYIAPYDSEKNIIENTVDMIFSQAVMEHVNDISTAYRTMTRWLAPKGFVSHQIDFRCHNTADEWNGHWTYSEFSWRLLCGGRPYLLNRQPYSVHVEGMRRHGLEPVYTRLVRSKSNLQHSELAKNFRNLSEQDLTTSGAFILARPSDDRSS